MSTNNPRPPLLSSDTPVKLPQQDAFGYAPFAASIARTAVETPSPSGLVLAINGPWGSGKSSLLNFIRHDLNALTKSRRPVVITFNPWLFDDHRALIGQFLAQFADKLPRDDATLAKAGDLLADYSDALGTAVGTLTHLPFLKYPVQWFLKLFKQREKDIAEIKEKVAEKLRAAGKRIVFMIDDIDRLDALEMATVFKAVKALADFPNVVYILAFDLDSVASALKESLRLDGRAYLEKIVQAPFSLPAIDKARLRGKLHAEINRIVDTSTLTRAEEGRWARIYLRGLDAYLTKPRDIVRIANALTVTYGTIAGEVNAVDFVTLEFIRVFEPTLYTIIRDNPGRFTGQGPGLMGTPSREEKEFHQAWLKTISDERRNTAETLARELFPRLDSIFGNSYYGAETYRRWKNNTRICTTEAFDNYFQLVVPEGRVSRSEFYRFLAADKPEMERILRAAGEIGNVEEYFESVVSAEEDLDSGQVRRLLGVIFDVADVVLPRVGSPGALFPLRWRLIGLVNALVPRLEAQDQVATLNHAVSAAKSLTFTLSLVDSIEQWKEKSVASSWLGQVPDDLLAGLRATVVARLEALSDAEIAHLSELDYVAIRWRRWGDEAAVIARLVQIVANDELLVPFLVGFLRYGSRQDAREVIQTVVPRLDPNDLAPYANIESLRPRVEKQISRSDLNVDEQTALRTFLRGLDLIKQGKDPGGFASINED
jgi:hypothetical protein